MAHFEIQPFEHGWRYLFDGDDDDAPLIYATYEEAAAAAELLASMEDEE